MDTDLRISRKDVDGRAVLHLAGELDAYTCPQFRDALIKGLDGDASEIILEMQDVEYIDSTGLGALVGGLKRASERNGHITIVCNNPQVTKVFDITGLVKVFPFYKTLEEALAAEREQPALSAVVS